MKALTETEVKEFLSENLRNWSLAGDHIKRDLKFKTFVEAFSFMTAGAIESEKLDHHPDWTNVYNSVTIRLRTHDANGITQLDFDLAKTFDSLFKKYEVNQ